MNIFKYNWQKFIFIGIFMAMVFMVNYIALEILSITKILIIWLFGFVFSGTIFLIRRNELKK